MVFRLVELFDDTVFPLNEHAHHDWVFLTEIRLRDDVVQTTLLHCYFELSWRGRLSLTLAMLVKR